MFLCHNSSEYQWIKTLGLNWIWSFFYFQSAFIPFLRRLLTSKLHWALGQRSLEEGGREVNMSLVWIESIFYQLFAFVIGWINVQRLKVIIAPVWVMSWFRAVAVSVGAVVLCLCMDPVKLAVTFSMDRIWIEHLHMSWETCLIRSDVSRVPTRNRLPLVQSKWCHRRECEVSRGFIELDVSLPRDVWPLAPVNTRTQSGGSGG